MALLFERLCMSHGVVSHCPVAEQWHVGKALQQRVEVAEVIATVMQRQGE
jgi:hypothetical protein